LAVLLQNGDILLEAGIAEGVGALKGGELILGRSLEANQAVGRVLHNNYKGIRIVHFIPSQPSSIDRFRY
jgi:hypothetical protein